MNDLELYNQICKLQPPDEIKSNLEKLYLLIVKELDRKHRDVIMADKLFETFINRCMQVGIAITISNFSEESSSPNINYVLLKELNEQIKTDIYNFNTITNRSEFY